jgi:hypothetical protein
VGSFSLYLHGRNFMSILKVIPKFSTQGKRISPGAENSGRSKTGKIAGTMVESEPLVKKEIKGDK